jgi:hypothetical protein
VALAFPLFSEAVHHRGIARIVSPEDPTPAAIEATKADYLDMLKASYPDKIN